MYNLNEFSLDEKTDYIRRDNQAANNPTSKTKLFEQSCQNRETLSFGLLIIFIKRTYYRIARPLIQQEEQGIRASTKDK